MNASGIYFWHHTGSGCFAEGKTFVSHCSFECSSQFGGWEQCYDLQIPQPGCPAGCDMCSGAGQCERCMSGLLLSPERTACQQTCSVELGQYLGSAGHCKESRGSQGQADRDDPKTELNDLIWYVILGGSICLISMYALKRKANEKSVEPPGDTYSTLPEAPATTSTTIERISSTDNERTLLGGGLSSGGSVQNGTSSRQLVYDHDKNRTRLHPVGPQTKVNPNPLQMERLGFHTDNEMMFFLTSDELDMEQVWEVESPLEAVDGLPYARDLLEDEDDLPVSISQDLILNSDRPAASSSSAPSYHCSDRPMSTTCPSASSTTSDDEPPKQRMSVVYDEMLNCFFDEAGNFYTREQILYHRQPIHRRQPAASFKKNRAGLRTAGEY